MPARFEKTAGTYLLDDKRLKALRCQGYLKLAECQVLEYCELSTNGWQRHGFNALHEHFMQATGLSLSAVEKAIRTLKKMRILTYDRVPGSQKMISYSINFDADEWRLPRPLEPIARPDFKDVAKWTSPVPEYGGDEPHPYQRTDDTRTGIRETPVPEYGGDEPQSGITTSAVPLLKKLLKKDLKKDPSPISSSLEQSGEEEEHSSFSLIRSSKEVSKRSDLDRVEMEWQIRTHLSGMGRKLSKANEENLAAYLAERNGPYSPSPPAYVWCYHRGLEELDSNTGFPPVAQAIHNANLVMDEYIKMRLAQIQEAPPAPVPPPRPNLSAPWRHKEMAKEWVVSILDQLPLLRDEACQEQAENYLTAVYPEVDREVYVGWCDEQFAKHNPKELLKHLVQADRAQWSKGIHDFDQHELEKVLGFARYRTENDYKENG